MKTLWLCKYHQVLDKKISLIKFYIYFVAIFTIVVEKKMVITDKFIKIKKFKNLHILQTEKRRGKKR